MQLSILDDATLSIRLSRLFKQMMRKQNYRADSLFEIDPRKEVWSVTVVMQQLVGLQRGDIL